MPTIDCFQRIRAEIDLDAIRLNLESMRNNLPGGTMMYAVIKAEAYGHGAVEISREIEEIPYLLGFCVATAEEGAALREAGIRKPILILGYTFPDSYDMIAECDLTPTIFSVESAKGLSETAKKHHKTIPFQLAIDTGMSRIGLQTAKEDAKEALRIVSLPGLSLAGAFTHFAKADETDKTATIEQYRLFHEMLHLLSDEGIQPPLRHCANSATIMELPEYAMDAVRAGITLYGLLPSAEVDPHRLSLTPVMALTSHVSHVKTLTEGRTISYGGTYTVHGTKTIATVPVGYADGYPRSLSNCGEVLIKGQRAPICGRVCMDQFMVDVTKIDGVQPGEEVRLLGSQGKERITMEELADKSGRINYELACDIGKRVPRVFLKDGRIVATRQF